MDAIDWSALSRLVPEVILVIVFMAFTRDERKRAEAAETERTKMRLAEIDSRDKNWREFLKEEREHRVNAITRLAEEIKAIGQSVNSSTAIMVAHDTWERQRYEDALRRGEK